MIGWSIRHVLWPAMEMRGNRIRSYLASMLNFQALPAEQIERARMDKMRELLAHSVRHVPAYRAYQEQVTAFLDAGKVMEALQCLPALSKKHFNTHRDEYFSEKADRGALIANRTGGSTGEPTRFYMDRVTVEHFEAARWRGLSWYGIRIGDPSVMLWGSTIELSQQQSKKFWFKERWLKNRIMIPAYELKEANLDQYVKQIEAFRPVYFYGYASALETFSRMLLRKGRRLQCRLKAVVSTAESLHPHQREVIEQAFGCKVVNEYGARDGGIMAYECPHGSMHISAENLMLEVVDVETKAPLPPGEKGLLLVTDLNNFSMPRLRYEVGDIAALGAGGCSCGIHLPTLASIHGREDDMFVGLDGSYVHGHYFNHIMRNLSGFLGFQLIQHTPTRVSLKLVKNGSLYKPEEEQTFIDGIYEALGRDIELTVVYVEDIPKGPSGKARYAIREFELR